MSHGGIREGRVGLIREVSSENAFQEVEQQGRESMWHVRRITNISPKLESGSPMRIQK